MAAKVIAAILIGLIANAQSAQDTSVCPARVRMQKYLHVYTDTCVLFVHTTKTWNDARSSCKSMGGDLVMIKDAYKQRFILNALNTDHWDTEQVWIGATDHEKEGVWKWVDGSKVVYQHFKDGQGNNHNSGFLFASGTAEDCALLKRHDGSGLWHDYPCSTSVFSRKYSYACEFSRLTVASTQAQRPTTTSKVMQTTTTSKATLAPTTTTAIVDTPEPTTMANVETPAPTTKMPNVETPAPTTVMPNVETPAPTTQMPNVETPAPTTQMPNVETPAPTTAMPNVETPQPTAIIGRRR